MHPKIPLYPVVNYNDLKLNSLRETIKEMRVLRIHFVERRNEIETILLEHELKVSNEAPATSFLLICWFTIP